MVPSAQIGYINLMLMFFRCMGSVNLMVSNTHRIYVAIELDHAKQQYIRSMILSTKGLSTKFVSETDKKYLFTVYKLKKRDNQNF